MQDKIMRGLVVASIVLLPGGIAYAKQGADDVIPHVGGSIDSSIHVETEIHGGTGRDHAEDDSLSASSSASSTHKGGYWSNPDNAEDVRGRGGDESREHSSTSSATSSHERLNDDNGNHRGGRGNGIGGFMSWFFALPDSTTVGDIKAQINASTSATAGTSSNDVSIFTKFLSFFHFGRGRDN